MQYQLNRMVGYYMLAVFLLVGNISVAQVSPLVDLAEFAGSEIDSRILGKTPPQSLKLFTTTGNNSPSSWERNLDVWTNSGSQALDLTGNSPWNSGSANLRTGTLISPRHMLAASHYHASSGASVVFVDNNNNVFERTIIGTTAVASAHDMELQVLNEDVPASIGFYPLIPSSSLKSLLERIESTYFELPVIVLDQEKKVLLSKVTHFSEYYAPFNLIYHEIYSTGVRAAFSEGAISGDSGNPVFLVADDKLVLLSGLWDGYTDPDFGSYIPEINDAIVRLGSDNGYRVTEYHPTSFIQYQLNHIPIFSGRSFQSHIAYRNFNAAKPITTIEATDIDGDEVSFAITALNSADSFLDPEDFFSIDPKTGELYQTANINIDELSDTLKLTISITDNAKAPAINSQDFFIKILNADLPFEMPKLEIDKRYSSLNISGIVRDAEIAADGKIILVGKFSSVNSRSQNNIAKINSLGVLDSSFANNIGSGAQTTTIGDEGSGLNVVKIRDDGKIYLGGYQDTFNGTFTGRLTRLNPNGTLDQNFLNGSGLGFNDFNESIYDIVLKDSRAFVTGFLRRWNLNWSLFQFSDGVDLVNDNGMLDADFHSTFNYGVGGQSYKLLPIQEKFFLTGSFNFYLFNNSPYEHFGLMALSTAGQVDTLFLTSISDHFQEFQSGVNNLALTQQGDIILVGSFKQSSALFSRYITKIDQTGVIDNSFNANLGEGFNGPINAIAIQPNGKILVGGSADILNGSFRGALFRLNADGTPDTEFQNSMGTGVNGNIKKIMLLPNDEIAVLGDLHEYNGIKLNSSFLVLKTADRTAPVVTLLTPTTIDSALALQLEVTANSDLAVMAGETLVMDGSISVRSLNIEGNLILGADRRFFVTPSSGPSPLKYYIVTYTVDGAKFLLVCSLREGNNIISYNFEDDAGNITSGQSDIFIETGPLPAAPVERNKPFDLIKSMGNSSNFSEAEISHQVVPAPDSNVTVDTNLGTNSTNLSENKSSCGKIDLTKQKLRIIKVYEAFRNFAVTQANQRGSSANQSNIDHVFAKVIKLTKKLPGAKFLCNQMLTCKKGAAKNIESEIRKLTRNLIKQVALVGRAHDTVAHFKLKVALLLSQFPSTLVACN